MILNIAAYHFADIHDVPDTAERIYSICDAHALLGSVLVAPEGVNFFLAGEPESLEACLTELQEDTRLAGLVIKRSWSEDVPFRRLKVKQKREIISFAGRPAATGAARSPSVLPETLARWFAQGHDDEGREVVMLDTRNQQEVAFGTFTDAVTLPIKKFNDLPEAVETVRGQLEGRRIVSFCTGGVRCEKAAPFLASAGFENVMQLEGGILRYFEDVGETGYTGGCFVFDERVALDPQLKPMQGVQFASAKDGPL
ncbi:sulfurtransferase [Lysobacter sp. HDW10]|uniref:sulfurtransferase n=1 Tax=Lysobacter sp. HDW10 TaxID=2714936 RepID=UPI0014095377|nr:sulfurtransferase [Lysobacter sp. HDW10]QIK81970.1 sulfurtransferase [Lysobacter sp. HDW10]